MKLYKKNINTAFLVLSMMSMVNLLFLHYYFLIIVGLEISCYKSSYIDNFAASVLDVSMIITFAWLITGRRIKAALVISFVFTLLWSFTNVFYARFFHQYLSLSSIGQADNLADESLISSILAGFEISDLFYPLITILFFYLLFHYNHCDLKRRSLRTGLSIWTITIVLELAAHSIYFFHPTTSFIYELEKTVFTPEKMDFMWPNWTVFHKGFFRKIVIEGFTRGKNITLTPNMEKAIEAEYKDHSQRITGHPIPDSVQNVIFILVESYLSATSDLVVNGAEITPNLNKLKHDSTVYYNGHMHPNVSIGESSDGQLIYMAGLLPLHSDITVSKARNNTIVGLPTQLKKRFPDLTSFTIIPTTPTLWDQQAMSDAYGFDKLYSSLDYKEENEKDDFKGFLNDERIFSFASQKALPNQSPFFSLILTMSMHQPYNTFEKHGFEVIDDNLPSKYKNYLTSCHYTDMQIGIFIKELKEKGLYENSLIVIAADHDAHPRNLDMEGKISDEIPIYIINGGIDKQNAWSGDCNQLDVYTTILDIMGIESQWRGLGHTLLNSNYKNSVTEKTQELSNWIIYGNYFKKKDIH